MRSGCEGESVAAKVRSAKRIGGKALRRHFTGTEQIRWRAKRGGLGHGPKNRGPEESGNSILDRRRGQFYSSPAMQDHSALSDTTAGHARSYSGRRSSSQADEPRIYRKRL